MVKPKPILFILLSVTGAALNIAVCYVSQNILKFPLFLDTIFTMSITFYGGLYAGLLTGALTNLTYHSVFFAGWPYYLYTLCNMAVALITYLFMRWFPRELNIHAPPLKNPNKNSFYLQRIIEKAIILILLSFSLCIVISITGGLFASIITLIEGTPEIAYEESVILDVGRNFKLALERKGLPLILVEIASRIPVNILDRLLSSFAGFGFALLLNKGHAKVSFILPVR